MGAARLPESPTTRESRLDVYEESTPLASSAVTHFTWPPPGPGLDWYASYSGSCGGFLTHRSYEPARIFSGGLVVGSADHAAPFSLLPNTPFTFSPNPLMEIFFGWCSGCLGMETVNTPLLRSASAWSASAP